MDRQAGANDASTFHVAVGDSVTFSKTIGESDVYLFAGITGDLGDNHINEQYMRDSAYGRRIAHGALLVGFMSTTSTMMIARSVTERTDETPVSLGYDRVRFLGPAYIGDTVKVVYTITRIDPVARRSYSKIEVTNEQGRLVAVAEHILKWVHRDQRVD
jgi:3-hydroxybutyryl-CoA dehydratase